MSTYEPGHAPTSTDYTYATQYANDVMEKAACLAQPEKYDWIPSTTRYPCPEGLACESGVCKFKQAACRERSTLPYYDCVRRTVACDTHPSGECEICDYSISNGHTIHGPYTEAPEGCSAGDYKYSREPEHPKPYTTPGLSLSGFCTHDDQCVLGSCVQPEPEAVLDHWGEACTSREDCGGRSVCASGHCVSDTTYEGTCAVTCTSSADCSGVGPTALCGEDPGDAALYGRCYLPTQPKAPQLCQPPARAFQPYTVKMYEGEQEVEKPVSCEIDEHCWIPPGVGGACGRDPTLPTYGVCYDPSLPPYLEWRDEIQLWDGVAPNKNVCVENDTQARRWCEMPWTRASPDAKDSPMDPLQARVKSGWKSRARPPFMYDERDSTCHITKTYCEANLKNGGVSAGYGRSHDFWLSSTCGGDTKGEVVGAYDCCTKLGDSIGEFILGRTLTTDLRELVKGDPEGFGARWGNYMRRLREKTHLPDGKALEAGAPGLYESLQFVCDPRLKTDIRRIAAHVVGADVPIHGYRWTWNKTAERVYGFTGSSTGMLTTEVARVFPWMVEVGKYGYHHISLNPGSAEDSRVYEAMIRL